MVVRYRFPSGSRRRRALRSAACPLSLFRHQSADYPHGCVGASCDGGPMLPSRTSRLAFLSVLAALVAVASTAPAASAAAPRYASPTGDGSDCSAAHPCSISQAVGPAIAGDEVIVAPGDYHLTANSLFAHAQVTVHGVAGQPRPRLLFSGPGQFGLNLASGATLGGLRSISRQRWGLVPSTPPRRRWIRSSRRAVRTVRRWPAAIARFATALWSHLLPMCPRLRPAVARAAT